MGIEYCLDRTEVTRLEGWVDWYRILFRQDRGDKAGGLGGWV